MHYSVKQYKSKAALLGVLGFFMVGVTGCGGISVWPFGKEKAPVVAGKPLDAAEYGCDAGKKFYVRNVENGNAVWLMLPDREVMLAKTGGSEPANRFSNKITTLTLNGSEATLELSADNTWKNCKVVSIKP